MNTPVEDAIPSKNSSEEFRDLQISDNLIRHATLNDSKGFLSLLQSLRNFELVKVMDKKLYTCFFKYNINFELNFILVAHLSCLNNNEEIFEAALNFVK